MARPIIAMVGRPNVGKSTLFNRLCGLRQAITEDQPGTTRDRLYGECTWQDREFVVVDTGGLDLIAADGVLASIRMQAQIAIREADLIVFVVDILTGMTTADADIASVLRQTTKPVVVAANKADSIKREAGVVDFYELGFPEVVAISAYHGAGCADLLDWISAQLPKQPEEDAEPVEPNEIRVAIVGRPNVGKSSLVNRLLGEDRAVVSPVPGTTRDAIDTLYQWEGRDYRLIDTAGIRRRGRIEGGVEQYSVLRAMRALAGADVAILLIDAAEGLTDGDLHIAGFAQQEYKGLVLGVNKWDLAPREQGLADNFLHTIRERFSFMAHAPIVFCSAKTGLHAHRLLEASAQVWDERHRRVGTGELNAFIHEASRRHVAAQQAHALKVLYATQPAVNPPTFILFVNDPSIVHFGYKRYIENEIRRTFGFEGTPIRLVFRGREQDGVARRPERSRRR